MTKQLEEIKRLAEDEKLIVEQRWQEIEWNKFASHTLAKHCLNLVAALEMCLEQRNAHTDTMNSVIGLNELDLLEAKNEFDAELSKILESK